MSGVTDSYVSNGSGDQIEAEALGHSDEFQLFLSTVTPAMTNDQKFMDELFMQLEAFRERQAYLTAHNLVPESEPPESPVTTQPPTPATQALPSAPATVTPSPSNSESFSSVAKVHPFPSTGQPSPYQNLTISAKLQEICWLVSPFQSKDDPDEWTKTLESLVETYGVSWKDLIDHLKLFFKESKDKEIQSWYESYRNRIRHQQRKDEDPYVIWKLLKEELISCYDMKLNAEKAFNSLCSYKHSNESAQDYINKVRLLGRQDEPNADEKRIVEMLYLHLPSNIRTLMPMRLQNHKRMVHFRSDFEQAIIEFRKQQAVPATSKR